MGGGQKARKLPPEYLKSEILGPIYLLKSLEKQAEKILKSLFAKKEKSAG